MRTETITRIKISASDGMVLTNGEVYGKEIFLGQGDSVENWHEITDEEYAKVLKEIELELEQ